MIRERFYLAAAVVLMLSALVGASADAQTTVVLTFEGLAHYEQVGGFYNGGAGGDYGITFTSYARAIVDEDAGGGGKFANEPSPSTVVFSSPGPNFIMNVPGGFTTGFSFYYTSAELGIVTVWSGENATGDNLATLELGINHNVCGAGGDPNPQPPEPITYVCWDPVGAPFGQMAKSVKFEVLAGLTGFDNITLGSEIPGNGNGPPTVDAGGPYLVKVDSSVQLDGTASDPDGDPLTLLWTAEAGSFDNATLEDPIYTPPGQAGIYVLTFTANDGELPAEATTTVVVYDPDGGFATGNGWIDAQAGWCQLDDVCAGAEGRASFGFVAKYKKGDQTPTGHTRFSAGNLDFNAEEYESLVVSQDGTSAQFQGAGTINGEMAPSGGPFKFKIWATDGDPDTLHIRIWYQEGGTDISVYDTGSGQPIGGGNIAVHAGR